MAKIELITKNLDKPCIKIDNIVIEESSEDYLHFSLGENLLKKVYLEDLPEKITIHLDRWEGLFGRVFFQRNSNKIHVRFVISLGFTEWNHKVSLGYFVKHFERSLLFNIEADLSVDYDAECYFFTIEYEKYFDYSLMEELRTILLKVEKVFDICIDEFSFEESDNDILAAFDIPDHLRTTCGQYLVYFQEFLNDIGLSAKVSILNKESATLLSIKPNNKEEALEKIHDALSLYLGITNLSDENLDKLRSENQELQVALNSLKSECYDFKRKLCHKETEVLTLQKANKVYENAISLMERSFDRLIIQKDREIDQVYRSNRALIKISEGVLLRSFRYLESQGRVESGEKFVRKTMNLIKIKFPWLELHVDLPKQISFKKDEE